MIAGARPRRRFRNFLRDRDGAYAVEFAIISSALIFTIIVIAQFAMIFLARDSLDTALQSASRAVLTGSFQKASVGVTDPSKILANLRATMCGAGAKTSVLTLDCSNMKVDVSVVSAFSAAQGASAVDSSGGWARGFGSNYTCPNPKSIAVIRAAIKYPLFVRALSFGFSSFADGSALVQSSVVFRVEQYQSGSSC